MDERKQIELCINMLYKYIKKNKKHSFKKITKKIKSIEDLEIDEKILDIVWFLDTDLKNRYKFVKNFIGEKNFNKHDIIFLTKYIYFNIPNTWN